ncbi:MAG: acyltransferase [Actinobacteria bacterium]|nr:acyltransferase [Actinomycetota bacterium]
MSTDAVNEDGAALPRIRTLDGVRGVAILLTLAFHSFDSSLSWGIFGERGVDLFFVLSGFLITGILIETTDQPNYFKNFIARRAVRILPLYYLYLVLFLVAAPMLVKLLPEAINVPAEFDDLGFGTPGIWTVWVYLQNFVLGQGPGKLPGMGHLWSLAVEEQFYLFWPVVVWFLPAKKRVPVFVWGIVASLVLRTVLLWGRVELPVLGEVNTYGAREFTFLRLDTLLLGALGALYFRDVAVRRWLGGLLTWVAKPYIMIPILLIGLLPNALLDSLDPDFFPFIAYGPGLTLIAVVFLLYVVRSAEGTLGPRLNRFTNWNLNLVLGKYSYAMYLFHYPIAHTLQATLPDKLGPLIGSLASFAITLVVSLAIAKVTWVLWEEPWLRLKKRFSYRPVVRDVSQGRGDSPIKRN